MKNNNFNLNRLIINEVSIQLGKVKFLLDAIETGKVRSIGEVLEYDRNITKQLRESAKRF